MTAETFCFVAEKDGRCLGVCSGEQDCKDELAEFYGNFVGFEINALATREAWDEYRARVPFTPGEPA